MFFAFVLSQHLNNTFLCLKLRQNVFPGRFNPPLITSGNFAFYFRSKWRPCWKHPYNIHMRLETALHPSRKWSGTYLGGLVPSRSLTTFDLCSFIQFITFKHEPL